MSQSAREQTNEQAEGVIKLPRHLHFYESDFNQYSDGYFDVPVISMCLTDYLPLTRVRYYDFDKTGT